MITTVFFDTEAEPGDKLDPAMQAEIDFLAPTTVDEGDIETEMLADLAVTTAKVNNGAITSPKIATKGVKTANIDDLAVGEGQLKPDAVTAEKAGVGVCTAHDYSGNPIENDFVFVTTDQYDYLDANDLIDPNVTYMITP